MRGSKYFGERFQNDKGRHLAGLRLNFKARRRSVFGGDRAAPAKAVVHADLDRVLVVAEARADDLGGTAGEGGAAKIVVLVLGLGRPVRGEHVFEAGADGPAVLLVAGRGEADRGAGHAHADIRIVTPSVAALGVKQARTPRVTETPGHRAELVVAGGDHGARREG